jgi:membrane protease YdiL (CAAX protease family)
LACTSYSAWHNYPQHPQLGVLMMIAWCVLLSPIFMYIRLKSKSVIAASIMHGSLNGTAGIALILITGGNDLSVGITGLAGFIALGLMIIAIFVYDQWIIKEKIMIGRIGNHL